MGSIFVGAITLRDGDIFSAKNKLGAIGYYCLESITAKHGNIYVTLRAVGDTLEQLRAEVEKHNKKNWRFPLQQDAFDVMEVEIAWFYEREVKKAGATI